MAELAAVKSLVREAFPGRKDIQVGHRPSGAPYLISSDPTEELPVISISHSRRIAALAIAPPEMAIGIDTETSDRAVQLERLAPRFLGDTQIGYWGAYTASLFWAWTIKEALYKAAGIPGLGLREIPLPLEVPLNARTADGEVTINGRRFSVIQVNYPDPGIILMLVISQPLLSPLPAE